MIIHVTFKSGAHQLFEMDDDYYHMFMDALDKFDPEQHLEFFTCDTGAVISLPEVAGAQFYIPIEHADKRWAEENED
jgi:hypothetical protein